MEGRLRKRCPRRSGRRPVGPGRPGRSVKEAMRRRGRGPSDLHVSKGSRSRSGGLARRVPGEKGTPRPGSLGRGWRGGPACRLVRWRTWAATKWCAATTCATLMDARVAPAENRGDGRKEGY